MSPIQQATPAEWDQAFAQPSGLFRWGEYEAYTAFRAVNEPCPVLWHVVESLPTDRPACELSVCPELSPKALPASVFEELSSRATGEAESAADDAVRAALVENLWKRCGIPGYPFVQLFCKVLSEYCKLIRLTADDS